MTKMSRFRRTAKIAPLVVAAGIGAAAFATVVPSTASASVRPNDTSPVTIVGTSDVYDSDLMQNVIIPRFQAAYPDYTLNYVSEGTGAAITTAEDGDADGLLVHAPSLENQFVASGYSYEPYGRAFFYGDYVLLGPASDPAGVGTSDDGHNIAGAFQDIAAAGAAGKADFVSRANTSGTSVEEHLIWGLTTGVTTCTVSTANGGGTQPSTTTGACPSPPSYPSWYHPTGLTQGPNVEAADSCDFTNASNNGGNDCYTLTDRGTFDYLESTGAISNLGIVTQNDAASAPGGSEELINTFHSYAVNPAAVPNGQDLNTTGAVDFLNFVTSPAEQTAIGQYLDSSNGGAPVFTPDASPMIAVPGLAKARDKAGNPVTVTGTLINDDPGTPPLASQPVTLEASVNGQNLIVANATTDSVGGFKFSFVPTATASYSVLTGELTQLENSTLDPTFSDMLAPANAAAGKTTVVGRVKVTSATMSGKTLSVGGTLGPAAIQTDGTVALLAKKPGHSSYVKQTAAAIKAGKTSFKLSVTLPEGKTKYEVTWAVPGQFTKGVSGVKTVTVS